MIFFRDPKTGPQFWSPLLDHRLRVILFALSDFVFQHIGKPIIVTHLLRTQQEQDEIYKDNDEYKTAPFHSVHQEGRGADISSRNFSPSEIDVILLFLNTSFEYDDQFATALLHDAGRGLHLHLQVSHENYTKINKTHLPATIN